MKVLEKVVVVKVVMVIEKVVEATRPKTAADHFREVTELMAQTFERKNKDYGNTTAQMYKQYGQTYYNIMIEQKLNRIKAITAQNSENYESVEDSLLDLANYAILAILDRREQL